MCFKSAKEDWLYVLQSIQNPDGFQIKEDRLELRGSVKVREQADK